MALKKARKKTKQTELLAVIPLTAVRVSPWDNDTTRRDANVVRTAHITCPWCGNALDTSMITSWSRDSGWVRLGIRADPKTFTHFFDDTDAFQGYCMLSHKRFAVGGVFCDANREVFCSNVRYPANGGLPVEDFAPWLQDSVGAQIEARNAAAVAAATSVSATPQAPASPRPGIVIPALQRRRKNVPTSPQAPNDAAFKQLDVLRPDNDPPREDPNVLRDTDITCPHCCNRARLPHEIVRGGGFWTLLAHKPHRFDVLDAFQGYCPIDNKRFAIGGAELRPGGIESYGKPYGGAVRPGVKDWARGSLCWARVHARAIDSGDTVWLTGIGMRICIGRYGSDVTFKDPRTARKRNYTQEELVKRRAYVMTPEQIEIANGVTPAARNRDSGTWRDTRDRDSERVRAAAFFFGDHDARYAGCLGCIGPALPGCPVHDRS